jgi:hypothetical protein
MGHRLDFRYAPPCKRWRYVNGPHLAALVRARATFEKGVFIERPDEVEMKVAA